VSVPSIAKKLLVEEERALEQHLIVKVEKRSFRTQIANETILIK